jgi:uncharacterized protein YndB with AHSA1/START domain
MSFNLTRPLGERGSEGCTVVAFERPTFVVFTWNAPPSIPAIRAGRKTRVEVRMTPLPEGTSVTLEHSGWGTGSDWDEAFSYFERAWDTVLARLRALFETGPVDWSTSD